MKSPIVETLRKAAYFAPLWADIMNAAADEIERLQKKESHLVNVGSVDKIKADAVREAQEWLETMDYHSYGEENQLLVEYAKKIEQGNT